MVKGTKIIKFTLESPGEQEQSWTVKPKSGTSGSNRQQTKPKKVARRKKTEEKMSTFAAETLERLKQVFMEGVTLDGPL